MPKTPRKRRSRGNAASAAPLSPNKKLPPGDASTPISSPSPSSAPVVATTNTTSRDDRVVIATQDDSNENIESDSDVEIITPSRFPHRMSTTSNSNANDNDNQNRDGDNEIQVMSSSATNPNVDYPHMRHLCGIYPFDTNQNDADRNSNNKSFCPKCYCVICDILASECKFWEGNHCSAHDKNAQSVQSRELGFRQRGGEGAIQSPSAPTIMTPRNQQHDFTSIALQLSRLSGATDEIRQQRKQQQQQQQQLLLRGGIAKEQKDKRISEIFLENFRRANALNEGNYATAAASAVTTVAPKQKKGKQSPPTSSSSALILNSNTSSSLQQKMEGDIPTLSLYNSFFVEGIKVGWPFPVVMKPQRQIIIHIMKALKNRRHVVLESPTGTGKSAAILCSVLAWQRYHFRLETMKQQQQLQQQQLCDVMEGDEEREEEEAVQKVKIIYCSRTHSQVAQMVAS